MEPGLWEIQVLLALLPCAVLPGSCQLISFDLLSLLPSFCLRVSQHELNPLHSGAKESSVALSAGVVILSNSMKNDQHIHMPDPVPTNSF